MTRGFTLLEMVVVMFIVAVISAIIYATFATLTNTVAEARVSAEELRLRSFLRRSFSTNLQSVHGGQEVDSDAFRFVGVDDEGRDGPLDAIRFVATAPLMGGMALPGDLKEVRYEVVGDDESDFSLDLDEEGEERGRELLVTETPLLGGNVQELDEDTGDFVADPNYESPYWSVPVRSMDVRYFDGADWLDEWDSMELGRFPWCVHIRINFAKTEEQLAQERDEGLDPTEDPDFEMVVPIPAGLGVTQDARALQEERLIWEAAHEGDTSVRSNAQDPERAESAPR